MRLPRAKPRNWNRRRLPLLKRIMHWMAVKVAISQKRASAMARVVLDNLKKVRWMRKRSKNRLMRPPHAMHSMNIMAWFSVVMDIWGFLGLVGGRSAA